MFFTVCLAAAKMQIRGNASQAIKQKFKASVRNLFLSPTFEEKQKQLTSIPLIIIEQ